MGTLGDLWSEIADDADDTTGEYATQIQRSVQAAIRFCERTTYYFNETRDITFSTVADQQWYGESDEDDIPTLVHIQAAWVYVGGQAYRLTPSPPEELESLSDNSASTGQPRDYVYFNQQIRLYPIPDQAYTVRLQVGPYRLAAVSAETDTNAWTEEAFDMIKARAKYILYKDTIKDAALAAEALNDYNDQHSEMTAETSKRNGTGKIRPTCF